MTYRMTLIALLSALVLILAACEVEDTGDDSPASDDTVEDVANDDDGESDDAIVEDEETEATTDDEDETTVDDEDSAEESSDNTDSQEVTEEDTESATEGDEEATDDAGADSDTDSDVGTRENPIPIGETAQMGEWEITVTDTIPDAQQAIMDENQFNDPPEEGMQFFIAALSATYLGEESSNFWIDVRLRAVDDGGVAYDGMDAYCGVIPDNISDRGEAFTGATIEGNTCWAVSSEHTNSLVMIVEPLFSWDRERLFFALNE
jgi:hypothetical protein